LPYIAFNQLVTPIGSAPYSVAVVSNATYVVTGDVGLEGTVLSLTSSGNIILRKNGRYVLTYRITGNTTATNSLLAASGVGQSTGSISGAGTALGSITAGSGKVAHAVFVGAATNGYDTSVTQEVYISGIADGTGNVNFATLTPPSFTTNGVSLVASVNFRTFVSWMSVGQGGQSVTFAPSAYP
jgi:hypothetical protein